jgi:AraC-like DNA-binding protein/mannose-6-phosphate isomerase-like protein (cupin superfamily)
MRWTDRLNAAVPRLQLDGLAVEVYEWAHWAAEVENPPHRHTYFEVCRVEGGQGRYVVADRAYQVGGGDLLFTRPGVRHQIISAEPPGIHLTWVAFDLSIPEHPADPEVHGLFRAFTRTAVALARDGGEVGAVWEALRVAAGGPPRRGQRAELAALATALLLGLARAGADEPPSPVPEPPDLGGRLVRHAVRYIHDNLDRPLRVAELARHVHLSPRQLSRLFAVHIGAPPAAYVERARLDRAAALLVRTPAPIKQVAAEVGYPGVVPFTRAFTRRHGAPPGRFRHAGDLSGVLTAPPLIGAQAWPDSSSPGPAAAKTTG